MNIVSVWPLTRRICRRSRAPGPRLEYSVLVPVGGSQEASMLRVKRASSYLLLTACLILAAGYFSHVEGQAGRVTVFEGARLITGGDDAPIENSAFVVQNSQFIRVGRRGEVQIPAAAVRVDLTGKTVMPTKVDLHGHIGFQHDADGTMAKEYFTRENLIDHLERMAYYGVS